MHDFQEYVPRMTTRKIGDTLSMFGVIVLFATAMYFGMGAAKNPRFFPFAYIASFMLVAVKRWFDKKPLIPRALRWQRFYISLLFLLVALSYLVQAVMDPLNGWKSARMWIFGLGWILLAVYELYIFYQNENAPETQ
jgi:hypothetical protein